MLVIINRFLFMAVLEKPTDVKVEPTDVKNVYNVSWKMVDSPELTYFKVQYGDAWHVTFTRDIPAANRSTLVSVDEREPGTIVDFYVYPFRGLAEIGENSDPASFVVPGGALFCLHSLKHLALTTHAFKLLMLYRIYVGNQKAFRSSTEYPM